jgi:UDP-N-acetyl-D-galactosamine dehydrogenase
LRRLMQRERSVPALVTVLGMTFKENVPDTRNSKVHDIVSELRACGLAVQVHDPLAVSADTEHEYGIALTRFDALKPADAVILAVVHDEYISGGWSLVTGLLKGGRGIVLDVKSKLDRGQKPKDIELWRM